MRRVIRSLRENITCRGFDSLDHGTFVFAVTGQTGETYEVLIDESVELWPPACSCLDSVHRPFLCKHVCFCLNKLGAREDLLADWLWTPDQEDLYDWLSNAPEIVD